MCFSSLNYHWVLKEPCVVLSLGCLLPQWLSSKESTCDAGATEDAGSIPGLGGSPGQGHGNPLQYFCLENPKDRGAWRAIVYRVAESWTWLKQLNRRIYRCVCVCVCVCVCISHIWLFAVSLTQKHVYLTTLLSYWICSNCFLLICLFFIYLLKIMIEGQGVDTGDLVGPLSSQSFI